MNVKNNIKLLKALVILFFTVNGQLFAYSLNILNISDSKKKRPLLQLIYVQDFEKLLTDALRYQYLMSFKLSLERIDDDLIAPSFMNTSSSNDLENLNKSKRNSSHKTSISTLLLYYIPFNRRSTRLFYKYYQSPLIDPIDIGSMIESTDKRRATAYFKEENYKIARKLFASIYHENANLQALFYQAICEVEEKNWKKAMMLFSDLVSKDSTNMEYKWYYSLIAIKRQEWELAALQLIDIKFSNHNKASEAEEIYRVISQCLI